MELWLLNTLDTLTLTVVVVGGVMLVSVLGVLVARRRFPELSDGQHNEMIGTSLGMFGAIYGIILAFVIVNLWTQLDTANTIVATESTAAATLVRDAGAFPPADQDRLKAAVGGYVHGVVNVQWPMMRAGTPNFAATETPLEGLYGAIQAYNPQSSSQQSYYNQAVSDLHALVAERRARITMATQALPVLLQVLVYGGALVIISLTFLFGVRSTRMQIIFVASVAALIGFSILLTIVLDRPFAGGFSVSPSPFQQGALAQFWP